MPIPCLWCAMVFLFPLAGYALTYTVNISDNSTNGHSDADPDEDSIDCVAIGQVGTNDCSLRRAIDETNSSTEAVTINLPADTITLTQANASGEEDLNDTGDIDYTNTTAITLTIQGNSAATSIINANGATLTDRVLELTTTGTFLINDVTLTGGSLPATGGAFRNGHTGSTVTFNDCVISNSTTTGSHGGGATVSGTVTFNDCTIKNNTVTTLSGNGGGLYMNGANSLTINRSTISGNSTNAAASTDGGGVFVASTATLTVTNSTISGNDTGAGEGGGIYTAGTGDSTITHSTIASNTAANGGGLYHNSTGTMTIEHTLLADNTGTSSGTECGGNSIVSNNYNIIENTANCTISGTTTNNVTGSDPGLTALADNGANHRTHKITSTSVAYDVIPSATCDTELTTMEDQRGLTRPQGSNCDIGAYEVDQTDPVVTVTTGDDSVECSIDTWTDAGATVSDNFSTGLTASASGSVVEETLGTYTITYTATADNDGNTDTDTRTVTVQDTTAPTITLNGNATMTHEAGTSYTDAGASVSDACDANPSITTNGSVNSSTLGAQTINYSALDATANTLSSSRTVTVQDTLAPVITLLGESAVIVAEGDTYADAGATASDSFQGNLTTNIVTVNSVDTAILGSYTITYNVSDSSNNAASQVTRSVTVQATDSTDGSDSEDNEDEGDGEEYSEDGDSEDGDSSVKPQVRTNGKFIRVFVSNIKVAQKRVNSKKIKKQFRKLIVGKLYEDTNYTTIVFLSANKHKAKVIVFRLTESNQLTKKATTSFIVQQRTQPKLRFKSSKKRIIAAVGKGANQRRTVLKLTPKGKLNKIR